jgi:hypothetical protein
MTASLALALLAASADAAPPPVPSGDWRLAVTDEEPDVGRIIGFADAGTMARQGTSVSFWLEYRLENPAEGADGYRGFVTADCSAFTYGTVGLARLAGGKVLEQGGEESGQAAAPGTNMRVVLETVCAGKLPAARLDPVAYAKASFAK